MSMKNFVLTTAGVLSLSAMASIANANSAPTCQSNEVLVKHGYPRIYKCVPNTTYALQVQCDSNGSQLNFVIPFITPGSAENLVNGPEFTVQGYNYISSQVDFPFDGKIQPSLDFSNTGNFSTTIAVYNDPQHRTFSLKVENGIVSFDGVAQNASDCRIQKTVYTNQQ